MLKVAKKEKSIEELKEVRSKRGRGAKRKGANFERELAKMLKAAWDISLVRTPSSGGFCKNNAKANEFRGDIVPADDDIILRLHIEAKNQKQISIMKWIDQAESDCPKGKIPIVVFHKDGTSKNYVTLELSDFLHLVPKKEIIFEKGE